MAVATASTHCTYQRKDGQAEGDRLNTKTVYLQTVTHISTNPARRRVTC